MFANEEGTFLETTDVTGVMERKADGFPSHLSFRIEGEEWEWLLIAKDTSGVW